MTGQNPHHLFCFGLGYTARALGERLLHEGWTVSGTCRSEAGTRELEAAGFKAFLFDGEKPLANIAEALAGVSHILQSAPPDSRGDPVLRWHGGDITALPGLRWVGYLSTTGVYGDKGGAWVDEATPPPAPTSERGRARLAAEEDWLKLWRDHKIPVHIFRLAGIYGPGRNPLETVLSGEARRIIKPGQVFSRIHRDDIVAVLKASMAKPHPGRVYNVCDDEAAPPQDVIAQAAKLLGRAAPPAIPYEEAELSPMAKSFYSENKRVRNDRIKQELGVSLAYPTYREGLQSLLKSLTA
jgi:nucleoside-diphosphate-sugar epimerase